MMLSPLYFDYNATTPVDPLVFEEMKPFYLNKYGNASSKHNFGYEANSAVKLGRKRVAELINADSADIYFTSGATESINIVHLGIAKAYSSKGKHIISTTLEHPAVLDSLGYLEQNGFSVTLLKADTQGLIDLEELTSQITDETILVSVMAANNEIGTVNDLEKIGSICRSKDVLFHTDASQAFGKIPLDVDKMNIDLLSFSGHKFYAPKGTGGFFLKSKRPSIKISPSVFGGGQEKRLRPGTLNTPGIAGLGKAAELCNKRMEQEIAHISKLRDKLLKGLQENLINIKVNGALTPRLSNNLNISIEGVESDKLMMEARDLAFSAGSACSSGSDRPSHVLRAIGLTDEEARTSIRLSIGRFTTQEEINFAVDCITKSALKIRNYSQ